MLLVLYNDHLLPINFLLSRRLDNGIHLYIFAQAYMVELYRETFVDLLRPKNSKSLKLDVKKDPKVICLCRSIIFCNSMGHVVFLRLANVLSCYAYLVLKFLRYLNISFWYLA